jgi:hypothetical protein
VENPVFVDLHVSGVASEVFTVKENSVVAKVGIAFGAVIAFIAGVPDGADSNAITNFDKSDAGSNTSNLSNDFMAWAAGVVTRSPILSDGGQVGMTDGGEEHFESDLMWFHFQKIVRIHDQR